MVWLVVSLVGLSATIGVLLIKIRLLQRAADEICGELQEKLNTDTNTLISISSRDSHLRRLAEELNSQLRLLREERLRFQNGDLKLKEDVTNISHDLRTPLTAICGYLDLLKKEEKSQAVSRYLDVIENRTRALKELTEELFRYSVVTSTADRLNYEIVSLNQVLEESVSAYYGVLKSRGITPKISIPDRKILRYLDEKAVSRILENVLSNAVKYSGGDLDIRLTEEGELIFSNSAPMLDEVQVGKLFDRFYTVEDAKRSTGLGLSIAKILTEQMNGRIEAGYDWGRLSISLSFGERLDKHEIQG